MRTTTLFTCLLAAGILISVPVQADSGVKASSVAAMPHPEGDARPVPFGPRVEVVWDRSGDRAAECENIGDFGDAYESPNRYRGDAFLMTEDRELVEFKIELEFAGVRELYFSIHRANAGSNVFARLEGWTDIVVEYTGVGRTYYTSGVLDPPVMLEAGYRYALGVSWAQPATKYGIDDEHYPQDFEGGEVLGGVALTLGSPPPIPTTVSLPPYNDGAYSLQICFNPRPGACCIDDNGYNYCSFETEFDCLDMSDPEHGVSVEFTAPGIECESGMCPLEDGACCVVAGSEVECLGFHNEYSCDDAGGIWHGGESCPDACTPTGACCVGAQCFNDRTETECEDLNGVYQGDATTCSTLDLPCRAGACCDGLSCEERTPENCQPPLLFAGPGTRCDQDPCEPRGACCIAVGVCEDQYTAAECAAAGGYFRGSGSACDSLEVPCLLGACCTVASGCRENPMPQSVCQGIGGTWRGEGTSCATLDPHCPGLCCDDEGCHGAQTPDACEFLEGIFIGYGSCELDTCDSFALYARLLSS